MWLPLEPRCGQPSSLLHGLPDALRVIGTADDDRRALPCAIARALDAEWVAFREQGGGWIGATRAGIGAQFIAEQVARRIDFTWVSQSPRGQLVRVAGSALDRSPRSAGAGIGEILIYVDPALDRSDSLVVIALPRPLDARRWELELVLQTWAALTNLRSRVAQVKELEAGLGLATRAACALHDLRHELTVASLEIDRISTESGSPLGARFDRVRRAISSAKALCEASVQVEAETPGQPTLALVAGLLRIEVDAARSLSGRGEAIEIDIRCGSDLAFPVQGELLSRIARNLVLNAIESSPDGERVSVEADLGPGEELVLRVIDRGRGMSTADRTDLLRFGRSERGGWGIGSVSVADCARRIGATRTVESCLGSGTIVEVRIPPAAGAWKSRNPDRRIGPSPAGTRD